MEDEKEFCNTEERTAGSVEETHRTGKPLQSEVKNKSSLSKQ